ncbi:hypothetical protein ACQREB_03595 [Candidatus Spyradosoma sp. SGI.093]
MAKISFPPRVKILLVFDADVRTLGVIALSRQQQKNIRRRRRLSVENQNSRAACRGNAFLGVSRRAGAREKSA